MNETVKVVSTDKETQGEFIEINAADFDENVHTLYDPEEVPVRAPSKKAK